MGTLPTDRDTADTAADHVTDHNTLHTLNNQLSEAWTAYVPVNTNITLGNGTQTAKYQRIGRTIHFMWRLTFGSTTAFTGGPSAGLPLPTATGRWLGTAFALDSGTQDYCWGVTISGTAASVRRDSGGGIGATIPFTWAVNDVLDMSGTYEAAS